MARCKVGEVWDSFINGQPDGQFRIDAIQPNGNFTGVHNGDAIQGVCKAGIISYTRVLKVYRGKYTNPNRIDGVRSHVARFRKRKVLTDDDIWVGTHGA